MSAAGSNPAPSAQKVISTRGSPSWTTSPTATLTALTVPVCSEMTGISIFIDSSRITVSPTATASPTSTTSSMTFATISARISTLCSRGTLANLQEWERAAGLGAKGGAGVVGAGAATVSLAPAAPGEHQVDPDHHDAEERADDGGVERREPRVQHGEVRVQEGVRDLGRRAHPEGADPPALAAACTHVGAPHQSGHAQQRLDRPRGPAEVVQS